ncbi:MAG: hypothetical protein MUE30_10720 [Spirosomaceae bacterium]|nr:hypothetical protein [Spirosomataceae bacterium]
MSKKKEWKEGELVLTFNLQKRQHNQLTPLMIEWQSVEHLVLEYFEEKMVEDLLQKAIEGIDGWSEEDLKMKFISFVLSLGNLKDGGKVVTFFDKKLVGVVDGIPLSVKSDFMMAKGFMNVYQTPFFHFQEYKPQINPTGEPMAQLLEAFLIAQEINRKDGKEIPLYGCEVIGRQWKFVTMEFKTYCVSKAYDCTDRDDFLKIIAMLRKFREILETRLLN